MKQRKLLICSFIFACLFSLVSPIAYAVDDSQELVNVSKTNQAYVSGVNKANLKVITIENGEYQPIDLDHLLKALNIDGTKYAIISTINSSIYLNRDMSDKIMINLSPTQASSKPIVLTDETGYKLLIRFSHNFIEENGFEKASDYETYSTQGINGYPEMLNYISYDHHTMGLTTIYNPNFKKENIQIPGINLPKGNSNISFSNNDLFSQSSMSTEERLKFAGYTEPEESKEEKSVIERVLGVRLGKRPDVTLVNKDALTKLMKDINAVGYLEWTPKKITPEVVREKTDIFKESKSQELKEMTDLEKFDSYQLGERKAWVLIDPQTHIYTINPVVFENEEDKQLVKDYVFGIKDIYEMNEEDLDYVPTRILLDLIKYTKDAKDVTVGASLLSTRLNKLSKVMMSIDETDKQLDDMLKDAPADSEEWGKNLSDEKDLHESINNISDNNEADIWGNDLWGVEDSEDSYSTGNEYEGGLDLSSGDDNQSNGESNPDETNTATTKEKYQITWGKLETLEEMDISYDMTNKMLTKNIYNNGLEILFQAQDLYGNSITPDELPIIEIIPPKYGMLVVQPYKVDSKIQFYLLLLALLIFISIILSILFTKSIRKSKVRESLKDSIKLKSINTSFDDFDDVQLKL